jgi:hypothetical protein
MTATAIFSPTGVLTVPGNALGNTIVTSRDPAGILVNGGPGERTILSYLLSRRATTGGT